MPFQGHILSKSNTDVDKELHPPAEFGNDLMFEDTKKVKTLEVFSKLPNTIFQMLLIENREFVGFKSVRYEIF